MMMMTMAGNVTSDVIKIPLLKTMLPIDKLQADRSILSIFVAHYELDAQMLYRMNRCGIFRPPCCEY